MKNLLTAASSLATLGLSLALVACSSGPAARPNEKVLEAGTTSNSRPFWTYDGDVDRKKMAEAMGDDPKDPKNMYVVSRATVDAEDYVPNCYSMASARTSTEIAEGISKVVKSSQALSESANATEFENIIANQTKQTVVGGAIVEKTWAKIEKDGKIKYQCWVVMAVPRENLKRLQDMVYTELSHENSGDPGLKDRVKTAMDKMQSTF